MFGALKPKVAPIPSLKEIPMGPFDIALDRLGIILPPAPKPVAAYVPFTRSHGGAGGGQLIFVSGQLPMKDGTLTCAGPVPTAVSLEQAADAARLCAINALAVLRDACQGDLDKISQILRLAVFVQSAPGFDAQPKVANGASELLAAVFGDAGKHARAAVGTNSLPLNATVELELLAELRTPAHMPGRPAL
jgi:enamine deaminase RidA (YjgF/YER057c/UK114 family)